MTTIQRDNYLIINDIENMSDAFDACRRGYENGFSAAVFCVNEGFSPDSSEKNELLNLPVITAVYSQDLCMIDTDALIYFDIRFSDKIFSISEDRFYNANRKRFEILFGKKRLFTLEDVFRKEPGSTVEIDYFSETSESYDEYFTRIFRDKTSFQIQAVAECLTALRNGETNKGFEKEAQNFYKLIKEMTKE